ncbi:hypothetical protein KR222_006270 [Zaprionus bogoriensis]|nr:hypothetical protein KR222_006270 [Zaprionus bogoriensis]
MGICRFFQQGSCRFGTKCHNEHFDVKQYLKADIESCINGKMWLFSAYGPFKDKPNIPNYIEDQSFEEVRYQAYESRRQNCSDQFHQQFTKEVHEATNKMKTMLQMSPQVIDMMIKIYEAPEGSGGGQQQALGNPNAAANPFAQQTSSIFGKPALSAAGATSGCSIFGVPAAAAPAAGNSIFGGASSVNNAGSSIFGGASSSNIFGQQQQQQVQPSIFGQQQQQQQLQPQPSVFGQQQRVQTSIFAQAVQQQQQVNPFGQPQAASFAGASGSVFAQAQPAIASPFGQSAAFGQQQQPVTAPGGIFGQAAAAANTSSNFAAAVPQQQQQAQAPPTGFFGQAAATSGFPQQQQKLQAEQQQQQQQLQLQQHQQQQQQQQQLGVGSNCSIYSRMEELTQEEIAAFKAEQFAPGQVPFKPPPRELC